MVRRFTQCFTLLATTVVFVGLAVQSGSGSDLDVIRIISTEPVIDRWQRSSQSPDAREMGDRQSPLVEEAKRFAQLLNPPQSEPAVPSGMSTSVLVQGETPKPPEIRPIQTRPKFALIATSCYPADPRESMALISEPGQESRWVKPGAKLGYLLVEEIHSGSMVYRDGEKLLTLNVDINAVEADHRAQVSPPPAPERVDRHAKNTGEPVLAKVVKSSERRTIPSERNRPKFHSLGPTR